MSQVLSMEAPISKLSLLDAYRQALADGYNSAVDTGRYSESAAQVMMGFLSAATIALRVLGDEPWATRFEQSAERLKEDWACFEEEIPALCADLDARS